MKFSWGRNELCDEIRNMRLTRLGLLGMEMREPDGVDRGKARTADFGDDFGLFGDDTSYVDPSMFADA